MACPSANGLQSPTPEQALGSLLSFEQRTELALLVSDITDAMRKRINDSFDITLHACGKQQSQMLRNDERDPDIGPPALPPRHETEEAKAHRAQAMRESGLPEQKLQDLRVDVLECFQSWRDGVLSSVVAASTAKEPDPEAAHSRQTNADQIIPPDHEILGLHINVESSDATLASLYPPVTSTLSPLPWKMKVEVLSAVLLLLLSQGRYVSYSRVFLLHLVSSFRLPLHVVAEEEAKIAQGLVAAANQMSANEAVRKRGVSSQLSRKWKVGLAGVAGAALIGITGGLATPLVAGAIGSVMGGIGLGGTVAAGLLTTLSSSGVIVGSLFGAYGYGVTSKMMDQYAREVQDFAFLPMASSRITNRESKNIPAEDRRLKVTVCISGWLTQEQDVVTPWLALGKGSEVFALRWELESLMKMGKAVESLVSSAIWTAASTELIRRTVFASLMFALWPITLLKVAKMVDNPFTIARNKADKAGLILADAIINKAQGDRPITLIGYSMGARLIYSCLMSLAERRAFGLVEGAVLIGTPAPSDASAWRSMRSVVAGRLVNVYSKQDQILAFLYRTSSIQLGVAGLQEIEEVLGIENVDVSDLISGHLRYQHSVGIILARIGWEDIDVQKVVKDRLCIEMLDNEDRRKRRKDFSSLQSNTLESQSSPTFQPTAGEKAHPLADPTDKVDIVFQELRSTKIMRKPLSQPITEEEDLISFDENEVSDLSHEGKVPEILDSKKERDDSASRYSQFRTEYKGKGTAPHSKEGAIRTHDVDDTGMAMREYDEPIVMIDEEDHELHYCEPVSIPDDESREVDRE